MGREDPLPARQRAFARTLSYVYQPDHAADARFAGLIDKLRNEPPSHRAKGDQK